jgi:hypothetical protein
MPQPMFTFLAMIRWNTAQFTCQKYARNLIIDKSFMIIEVWLVGYSSMTRSPSSKLGLNAYSVIHRGLNSLLAAQIAFRGLHGDVP